MRRLLFSLAPLLLASPGLSQTVKSAPPAVSRGTTAMGFVTAFHGAAGGLGELGVYREHSGSLFLRPAWGRDLRLLPIDFVGRTQIEEHLLDRPRLRDDVPGASRLELPQQRGTLYHYQRQPANGDLRFGFFVIEPDGRPRRVHERVGTGPGGVDDPFVGRVAVDPAGQGLLVATTLAAGGDLIEVHLARGQATLRTAQLPPLVFSDAGLWLAPDWGFGVAHDGFYRFLRTPSDSADAVVFPGVAPGWFSGEAVCSPLHTFAATTAGAGPASQHVWIIGRDGPARRATRFPGNFSGAGFLPESPLGPYLAVSDDGALCAWRSEGLRREAWMAPVKA
ncbi:MAG: hypothetical protein V3T22_03165, partial [Planctomycetota bacterium]